MKRPTPQDNKNLIRAALKHVPETNQSAAATFAEKLFGNADYEDLAAQTPEALATLITKGQKALGRQQISVQSLTGDQNLIIVALDNRPFITDSVLAELAVQDLTIQLVVHPVIDKNSLVMVVISKVDPVTVNTIKQNLTGVVEQIKQVTGDWKPMLDRLSKTIDTFRTSPPPLPSQNIAEGIQFLEWLVNNNFTFQGIREYNYSGSRKSGRLVPVKGSALGILRDENLHLMSRGGKPVVLTPEIRDFLFNEDPLIITKANLRSRVHRRNHLDYIGIKRFTDDGILVGELRVVGLFTSTAYTKSVMTIPVLRHKANAVLEYYKADPASHTGKALINIVETWPRDEMFQLDINTLAEFTQIAARLDERPRVRVLSRADRFDRFVSVVAYMPRDRYDTDVRIKTGDYLARVYDGYLSTFFPAFLDNGLTRVHFIIGRKKGKTPEVPRHQLEAAVTEITRSWADRLTTAIGQPVSGHFPLAYQENVSPQEAVKDVALIDSLDDDGEIAIDFHSLQEATDAGNRVALKLFHIGSAVPLSRRVPLLENLGFWVIEESTFEIVREDGVTVYVHDMILQTASGDPVDRKTADPLLEETLQALWQGRTDNDRFNALVLACGLDWKQAAIFRAYARYLRQVRSRFTIESMAKTLTRLSPLTRELATLFDIRFNPATKGRAKKELAVISSLTEALDKVQSSDDDRIMRNFLNMLGATLRTNFYSPALQEPGTEDVPPPVLAFKVDPAAVNIMPQPVPYREIFVSSPRVEGLHLRFGPVARGGLRWSDRSQDYRTEVLGLVKAQQVKNAVIVPVGSKGGFVPKRLPVDGDRNAWFAEGRRAYQIFISSLLSLTDNLVDGQVVCPPGIVRHDSDDPYFVVAADKGTSTFSDTANAISQAHDFWLDDAFASGGSAGYDHKVMGITAKGAWEAVKRHFREMNRDIQTEPFTVAGVGDMSGDVFGNGMLLSKQTRLIAAFDHRDIFIDPDPDAATSFKERARLFKLGRSSWQDYNSKLISKGGGVFSRSAKTIKLSAPAARAIGFEAGEHTPQTVLNAILKAPVDLMWFGGIGTYIRASHESNAEAGDRANDLIRITSKQVRCKVIGEGANLAVTQPGRIEYNMLGGRCNSDAIDNSAGVNSSDVEVNIKIALAAAMKAGKLTRPKRNILLESMTPSVAELVLRNNYLQPLAISQSQQKGMEDFTSQKRFMQGLEIRGLLDRAVEDLPDDTVMEERRATGIPLTRAEIGVLLAYAKIVALDDLVASQVPDDPWLEDLLVDYFPPKMQKPYAQQIAHHQLRREIIGTVLANSMINRGGPTYISRVADHTGAKPDGVAKAYVTVRDAFGTMDIYNQIDALDNRVDGQLQLELYGIVQELIIEKTIWFVRYANYADGIGPVASDYGKAVRELTPKLEQIVPDFIRERIKQNAKRYMDANVSKKTALTLARLPVAGLVPDIHFAAAQTGKTLSQAAAAFFSVTDYFRIGRMVEAAESIKTADYYDGLALDRALQSLHLARRNIVTGILQHHDANTKNWLDANSETVSRTRQQMADIVEAGPATVSRLTVAANILADMARNQTET